MESALFARVWRKWIKLTNSVAMRLLVANRTTKLSAWYENDMASIINKKMWPISVTSRSLKNNTVMLIGSVIRIKISVINIMVRFTRLFRWMVEPVPLMPNESACLLCLARKQTSRVFATTSKTNGTYEYRKEWTFQIRETKHSFFKMFLN